MTQGSALHVRFQKAVKRRPRVKIVEAAITPAPLVGVVVSFVAMSVSDEISSERSSVDSSVGCSVGSSVGAVGLAIVGSPVIGSAT